jgi:hypothetical protein
MLGGAIQPGGQTVLAEMAAKAQAELKAPGIAEAS